MNHLVEAAIARPGAWSLEGVNHRGVIGWNSEVLGQRSSSTLFSVLGRVKRPRAAGERMEGMGRVLQLMWQGIANQEPLLVWYSAAELLG